MNKIISKSMMKRINIMKGLPMDTEYKIRELEDEIEQLGYLIQRNIIKLSVEDRLIYAKLSNKIHDRREKWRHERELRQK